MVIPRVDMEVVVEFLEGDPDQPLVTGCVYNGRNAVPYELPEHKTRSTFRSKTHQESRDKFNELRFEDKAGEEEIFVHAQKDRNEKVRNNHTERIDANWLQSVGCDKSISVENDHDEVIGGNMSIFIGSTAIANVVKSQLSRFTNSIGAAARSMRMGKLPGLDRGNLIINTEANRIDATGVSSTDITGVSKSILSNGRIQIEAGRLAEVHAGRVLDLDSAVFLSLSASEKITINCGESRLVLDADGKVHIFGKTVNMNAAESMHLSAGNSMVIKAKRVDIN